MQECAAKWRNMSIEEKAPYQKLADVDKERWQTEKAAEKKPKDQYRPKRPPSAYFLFLRDFREQWKNEHEGELKAEVEAKQAIAAEEKKKEEDKESAESEDADSQLTIDESSQSSNNNKPDLSESSPTPDQTVPTPGGKKEKPPRKMSRVVVSIFAKHLLITLRVCELSTTRDIGLFSINCCPSLPQTICGGHFFDIKKWLNSFAHRTNFAARLYYGILKFKLTLTVPTCTHILY